MRQIKTNIRFLVTVSVFLLCFTQVPTRVYCQSGNDFKWPNGAKAAFCLTYDDGFFSHINKVVPLLKKYHFKATFYLTPLSGSINLEMEKWKSLAKDGHELGNHTVYHPCRKSEKVKDYLDLDQYTTEQILAEIAVANTFLQALDGKKTRTFAYPCTDMYAGGLSFKDSVAHYATAARGGFYDPPEPLNPRDIDIYNAPAWGPNNNSSKELIDYIKAVLEKGSFGAFIFHGIGIGEESMKISEEDHETMLKFLDAHRNEIWVTTFQEATDYLISYRQRNKQ